MKPKISVILTTYMRPERLERAIKSILSQSFTDFELIVVDDASVDNTDEVVEKFKKKDPRVRYIKRDANFGTHTRPKNEGTKAAKANLIAYFDDDNIMLPSHLQTLYRYLKDSQSDIVYGQSIMIDESGKNSPRLAITSDINSQNAINIYEKNFIDTNQVLIRKKKIEEIGGWDESLPRYADWNLFLRLKKVNAKFFHVPIVITQYHVHQGMNQSKHPNFMFDTYGCRVWPEQTLYGQRPQIKVAVFSLVKDRLDYTKETFSSLKENTEYPYDHYVVDNGSTDGTTRWLEKKENKGELKKVIYNKENVGISKGSNQALEAIGKDYDIIIKVDNDCRTWTKGWLESAIDIYLSNPRMVLSPTVEGLVDSPGGVPRQFGYSQIRSHLIGMTPHIGGIFCIAPAEVYKNFRWPENDFLHSNQDWQFSQYARNMGYTLGYVENIRCEHIDGTDGQRAKYADYFELRDEERKTRYVESN